MTDYDALASQVIGGGRVERDVARQMLEPDEVTLLPLLQGARRVREHAYGRDVHLHVLRNAKSGACPEDCAFCVQSSRYDSGDQRYPMQSVEALVAGAVEAHALGAKRYCMVTATRGPSAADLDTICDATRRIKAEFRGELSICTSLGLLDDAAATQLAEAGVDRFNHNLETSRGFYPEVVGTHTFESRINTVRAARRAGMEACCGGILGMGETLDDRVDLAFELQALEVASIPVNFLDPRPGTPLADAPQPAADDCLRALAMFRFVNPSADLRIAGGREKALGDKQGLALYAANSLFCNGYLTTDGQGYTADMALIEEAGFRVSVVAP